MKRRKFTKNLAKSSLLAFLLPSGLIFQGSRKDTVITLTVDTENINQENILSSVSLSDNQGGSGQNPIDYTTPIDPGTSVSWDGVPVNPDAGHKVLITRIQVKGEQGSKVLKKGRYTGNGRVNGNAKDNYTEGIDSYSISFKVIKGGDRPDDYILDPKLKMNPS